MKQLSRKSNLDKLAFVWLLAGMAVLVFVILLCVILYNLLPPFPWLPTLVAPGGILLVLVGWLLLVAAYQEQQYRSGLPPLDFSSSIGQREVLEHIDAIREHAAHTGKYSAALIALAPATPLAASLLSALLYMGVPQFQGRGWLAILVASLVVLITWCLLSLPYRRFTAADRANMSSYELLLNRLHELECWLVQTAPESRDGKQTQSVTVQELPQVESSPAKPLPADQQHGMPYAHLSEMYEIGKREIQSYFHALCCGLTTPSLSWMSALCYVNMWRLVHRADEALIYIEPVEAVVRDAVHDEMCIKDSTIENREDLLLKLRKAVKMLNESAAIYLIQTAPSEPDEKKSADTVAMPSSEVVAQREMQARAILRDVRYSLHKFRDDRWERLVRTRNHLVTMALLTGLFLYLLLVFAILAGFSLAALKAATTFYLVGVIVGLFSRLYSQSRADTSIDDYRLAVARLLAAPLFSGIAAIGGVLIIQNAGSGTADTFSSITVANLLVASTFGLTPNLFTNAIQRAAEQYKSDLRSTEAPVREKPRA